MQTGRNRAKAVVVASGSVCLWMILVASGYEVSVPIINADLNRYGGGASMVSQLRRLDAKRVFLATDRYHATDEDARKETMRLLKENCSFFKSQGFEVGVWNWSFWGYDRMPFTKLQSPGGETFGGTRACPLDRGFRKMAAGYLQDFVRSGVDIILFDDDYRFGMQYAERQTCTCPLHMERIRKMLGEEILPADLEKKACSGGPNRYRDAVMKANGDALREFAAEMRLAVDAVNPKTRLGVCAVMSLWDEDGVDAATVSRILAGKTRPFLRLIGAPYWAVKRRFYGERLQNIVEFERMERSWCGDGIEIVAEGDAYPRPRWRCPASCLELFDLAMRADGRLNGILKYALDYYSPAGYETGYADRHVRNRPVYEAVERLFSNKTAVGVRVFEPMNKYAKATVPPEIAGTTRFAQKLFGSASAMMMSDCGIPTQHEGDGVCLAVFGESARSLPESEFGKGLIIDLPAARILSERGVDVGLRACGNCVRVTDELFDGGGTLVNQDEFAACRLTLDPQAEVVSSFVLNKLLMRLGTDRFPAAYRYANAAGNRFFVFSFDASCLNGDGFRRSTARSRQVRDAVRWLSGRPLPAYAGGHPDCYVMAKKSERAMAVGLWNMFADDVIDPVVELDDDYASVEFVGCTGRMDGRTVCLSDLKPYSFAAFEVSKE